jgi:hypothetical protein
MARGATTRGATTRGTTGKVQEGPRCKWGHPLFGANLYVKPDGKKKCRECANASKRRYDERKRREKNDGGVVRDETASAASPQGWRDQLRTVPKGR